MIESNSNPPFAWATIAKPAEGWQNQDAHVCVKGQGGAALAVLDGVGGSIDGGKASHLAERFLFQNFNMTDFRRSADELQERIQTILQLTDRVLKDATKRGERREALYFWEQPAFIPGESCNLIHQDQLVNGMLHQGVTVSLQRTHE